MNKHFTSKVLYQWSKVFTNDGNLDKEKLLGFGWTIKNGKLKQLFISPCEKFLIKKSFLCYYGIPLKFSIPTRKKGCFLMQPIALINPTVRSFAWKEIKKYKKLPQYEEVDFAIRNVGLYKEKAVLFDW